MTLCGSIFQTLRELSLIMTKRGVEAFQKILRIISSPPIDTADKNSNPVNISKNKPALNEKLLHLSCDHLSLDLLFDYIISVFGAYTSCIKNEISAFDQQ